MGAVQCRQEGGCGEKGQEGEPVRPAAGAPTGLVAEHRAAHGCAGRLGAAPELVALLRAELLAVRRLRFHSGQC